MIRPGHVSVSSGHDPDYSLHLLNSNLNFNPNLTQSLGDHNGAGLDFRCRSTTSGCAMVGYAWEIERQVVLIPTS